MKFIVSAWNNGNLNYCNKSFGVRFKLKDRNICFKKTHRNIMLSIEGNDFFSINLTQGFWNKCPEFKHKEIGLWFYKNRIIPWKKGSPPKFHLTKVEEGKFLLERISK